MTGYFPSSYTRAPIGEPDFLNQSGEATILVSDPDSLQSFWALRFIHAESNGVCDISVQRDFVSVVLKYCFHKTVIYRRLFLNSIDLFHTSAYTPFFTRAEQKRYPDASEGNLGAK